MSSTPQDVQALIAQAKAELLKAGTSGTAWAKEHGIDDTKWPTGPREHWTNGYVLLDRASVEAGQLVAPTPAPPPVPTPKPSAGDPAFHGPWYAIDSPWRTPVPADCPVHPDVEAMVEGVYIGTDYSSYDIHAFAYRVAENTKKANDQAAASGKPAPGFPWNGANIMKWCGPGQQENIIFAPEGTPTITVWRDTPSYKASSFQVPMPFDWDGYNQRQEAPAYYERRTTVVCENGDLWYLYGVTPPGHLIRDNATVKDTVWHASFVGKDAYGGWKGGLPAWNQGGSGFPTFVGTITPYDILNTPVGGSYGHALALNASFAADGSYPGHPKFVWPAPFNVYGTHPATDGKTKTAVGIPHGARIFWDPTLTDADFKAMDITKEWQLQIARTLRDKGGMSRESVAGQGGAGGLISESVESIAWNIKAGFYPAGFELPWMKDGTMDDADQNSSSYNAALPAAAFPETESRWKVADYSKSVPGITVVA